jgi:RIO-like serine/threonine protein kinase
MSGLGMRFSVARRKLSASSLCWRLIASFACAASEFVMLTTLGGGVKVPKPESVDGRSLVIGV